MDKFIKEKYNGEKGNELMDVVADYLIKEYGTDLNKEVLEDKDTRGSYIREFVATGLVLIGMERKQEAEKEFNMLKKTPNVLKASEEYLADLNQLMHSKYEGLKDFDEIFIKDVTEDLDGKYKLKKVIYKQGNNHDFIYFDENEDEKGLVGDALIQFYKLLETNKGYVEMEMKENYLDNLDELIKVVAIHSQWRKVYRPVDELGV